MDADSTNATEDLVTRLRCTLHFPSDMACVKCEAADEIERLWAENAELQSLLAGATRFNGGCCGR